MRKLIGKMLSLGFQVRLVAASALRAASFGGRRLLSAPGTGGAFPPLPKFHPLCYDITILDNGRRVSHFRGMVHFNASAVIRGIT